MTEKSFIVKCDGTNLGVVKAKDAEEAITRVKFFSHWEAWEEGTVEYESTSD